jgi:DNA replication protein DnaC
MELEHLLGKLKMDHLEAQLDAVCEQAAQRQADYKTFLVQALQTEWQGRYQRGTELRLRQARFPWLKTLEQFDFDFQPSLDRRQIRELAGMSFVERAHNVIVLGPPGVGKTHLAIALGIKAVESGYSVLFLTLEELIGRLVRAAKESRLEHNLQKLTYPKVLIIDEIGYLPLSSFPVLATAILDRLLHYSTTLNIKGESYRLKEKRRAGLLGGGGVPVPSEKEVQAQS